MKILEQLELKDYYDLFLWYDVFDETCKNFKCYSIELCDKIFPNISTCPCLHYSRVRYVKERVHNIAKEFNKRVYFKAVIRKSRTSLNAEGKYKVKYKQGTIMEDKLGMGFFVYKHPLYFNPEVKLIQVLALSEPQLVNRICGRIDPYSLDQFYMYGKEAHFLKSPHTVIKRIKVLD